MFPGGRHARSALVSPQVSAPARHPRDSVMTRPALPSPAHAHSQVLRPALGWVVAWVVVFALAPTCQANPDAKRLYDDLLSSYNRLIRPVQNNTDKITVWMRLRLSQLIDLVSPTHTPIRPRIHPWPSPTTPPAHQPAHPPACSPAFPPVLPAARRPYFLPVSVMRSDPAGRYPVLTSAAPRDCVAPAASS